MMTRARQRRRQPFWRRWSIAALCWCSLLWPLAVRAESARILVVDGSGLPRDVGKAARHALASAGKLVDPSDYISSARNQGLDPSSAAALTRVAPGAGATLVVSIDAERGKLQVTYRDGRSGAVVHRQSLVMHGKRAKLSPQAHRALVAVARRALAELRGQRAQAQAQAGAAERAAEPESEAEPPPTAAVAPELTPTAAVEPAPSQSEAAPESSAPAPSGALGERLTVHASVGVGAGGRTVRQPSRSGERDLDTGFFPALAVGLGAEGMLGSHWLLSAQGDYRTLLGLHAAQMLASGVGSQTTVRSHGLVFGLAPGYRFGERGSVDLRLFLGWSFRGLRPVVDAVLPGLSLHGPVLRPELRIPFADGAVTLRIAPELMVVAAISTTLEDGRTGLARSGLGLGGEVSLDVRLADSIYIGVEYRESRLTVASSWGTELFDLERFAIARAILQY